MADGNYRAYERKSADGADAPEMPAELKKMQTDIKSALDQLMKSVDTKNEATTRNITSVIEKYDDLQSKYFADKKTHEDKLVAAEKKAEDNERRVKDLEQKIATGMIGHNGGPALTDEYHPQRQAPEYKSFFGSLFTQKAFEAVAPETKALLRTDQDQAGGYLLPPIMDNQIRKKVVELSPVRAYATARTMTGKSMSIPVRTALLDSSYEGEAEQDGADASKYGEVNVTAWRHSVTVPVTLDQLIMSAFNMEQEVSSDVGQSYAKKEGKLFLTGTGSKMPEGITVNPQVLAGKTTTTTTALVTFDDIARLIGSMKTGYNPTLFFNRLTFSGLIQLKDKYGRPLWQPVAGDRPATIWDEPYTKSFIDLDSLVTPTLTSGEITANATSNTIPIMYADLRQGYEIFDLMGMSVIRDDVTQKRKAIIEYTFRRYNTAKVVMPEAIKLLKVA